jgi:hypothetical protein
MFLGSGSLDLVDNRRIRSTHIRRSESIRRLEVFSGLFIFTIALIFAPRALTRESVRAELIRLQDQYGLTVAWLNNRDQTASLRRRTAVVNGTQAIPFEKRAIVALHDSLQAFGLEGLNFADIPKLATNDMCRSHDGRKVAATMLCPPRARLQIFDLDTKMTETIDSNVEERMHFTSQCWSRKDEQVAFETEASVKVYRIGGQMSSVRVLAKGTDVTWSPDGDWIAFRDHDTYYAIRPRANGRNRLFHNQWGHAVSALYWSPDSRIVAYVRELGFFQGGALDAEVNQLRVRRLEDGSEDRLCPHSVDWYANYHWITSSELMRHPGSEAPH